MKAVPPYLMLNGQAEEAGKLYGALRAGEPLMEEMQATEWAEKLAKGRMAYGGFVADVGGRS